MILLEIITSVESEFTSEIVRLFASFVFKYLWGFVGLIFIWYGYKNLVTIVRPRISISIDDLETNGTKNHNLIIENSKWFMGVFTTRKEASIENAVIPIISEHKFQEFIQKTKHHNNPNLFEISLNEEANNRPDIIYEPKVYLSLSNISKEKLKSEGSTDFINSYNFKELHGCIDNFGTLDANIIKLLNQNNIVVGANVIILEENVTIKEKFWTGIIAILIGIVSSVVYLFYMIGRFA